MKKHQMNTVIQTKSFAAYVESLGTKADDIAEAIDTESDDYDSEAAVAALKSLKAMVKSTDSVDYTVEDEETLATEDETADADDIKEAIDLAIKYEGAAPDPRKLRGMGSLGYSCTYW